MAGAGQAAPESVLGMSDEDFMNQNGPAAPALKAGADDQDSKDDTDPADPLGSKEEDTDANAEPAADESNKDEDEDADDKDEGAGGTDGEEKDDSAGDADKSGDAAADADAAKPDKTKGDGEAKRDDKSAEAKPSPEVVPEVDDAAVRSFYSKVMTPFKANGKTVELKTADEAITLMQMGANYTRRMQEIAPYRKVLTMLEKNDLLDTNKLSYLIDLQDKNPEAIKKLVKDSGIDTLDLDTDSGKEYTASDHSVSDSEMSFRTTLEEVSDLDGGAETIHEINSTWDEQSKGIVWENPEIIRVMHQQRQLGVYPTIVAEMERMKTLGRIPSATPFIQAYKTAGDALAEKGAFKHLDATDSDAVTNLSRDGKPGQVDPDKKVIATRAAAPRSQVANGERASAAAPSRSGSATAKAAPKNPLAMSDEDFMKADELRNRV